MYEFRQKIGSSVHRVYLLCRYESVYHTYIRVFPARKKWEPFSRWKPEKDFYALHNSANVVKYVHRKNVVLARVWENKTT
jgi:hypothetical protein